MALSSSLVSFGTIAAIYGLLALGLNIKFGYNGLLDIGHVAFFLNRWRSASWWSESV